MIAQDRDLIEVSQAIVEKLKTDSTSSLQMIHQGCRHRNIPVWIIARRFRDTELKCIKVWSNDKEECPYSMFVSTRDNCLAYAELLAESTSESENMQKLAHTGELNEIIN